MHGREGEERKRRRHMWPVPALGTTTVASDSTSSSTFDYFCKDGRKISVGDTALFKPPQESPPFIGIIRWLTSGKENNLKLGVNWLYRPAEVKLGKGILPEAAPNEVFYSFHKDEIPAASLLHPCKVAFLRKGVELPSGISSFVCRRVYDIANKCLWWLTDQDYINERQEEVDQLLDKTRLEMHAAVQSGGRSPKPLNGPTATPPIKPGSDSVQNSATSLPSQGKGKKRERGDQGSDPIKRERYSRTDDGDSGHFRAENMLKSDIAKITDKGGLVDLEGVEKFVQLMQPDRAEKKMDLASRKMLADVIAATDRYDCLSRFVQLRGLPVLDEWLQEVHKGKVGDGSSSKEGDKLIEEFLLALLCALDKLPVNLHALQTCNIGKSVNNLRSHKNLEIQKKARSLVDTWKKGVEAEMKINDAKSGSSQSVSWHSKPGFSEVSHGGSRRTGGSSEVAVKSSITQPSASKSSQVKLGHGDAVSKSTSTTPGSVKLSTPLPAPVATVSKDSHCKVAVSGGASDQPLSTIKEEKSSSSSQSQNNSQSCSSDHAKTVGSSCKEDARSSTAGSICVNKTSGAASRHRKSSNGFLGSAVSGVQKETALGKCSSMNRNATSEKVSHSGLTCERAPDPTTADHGGGHRLIVRLPNPVRSPARSVSGGSFDDPSIMVSRVSSPGHSEKHDHSDRKVKGKNDACRANIVGDVNTESWLSNDVKDGVIASDDGDGSPAAVPDDEHCRNTDENAKTTDASKATGSLSGMDPKSGTSYEASYSSINALISCVKYSEASTSMVGDDVGMNLLASVATGEMSKSDLVSPIGSPRRSSPVLEDSYTNNDAKVRLSHEDAGPRSQGQLDEAADGDTEKQGDGKITCAEEKAMGEQTEQQLQVASKILQQTVDSCFKSDGRPDNSTGAASVALCAPEAREDGADGGVNQLRERNKSAVPGANDGFPDIKPKARSPLLDEKKKVDHLEDKINSINRLAPSDFVRGSVVDACKIENSVSVTKIEKESIDESPSCSSMELDGENKNPVHEGFKAGIVAEQKPPAVGESGAVEFSGKDVPLPSGSGNVMCPKNEFQDEKPDDVDLRNHIEQSESQRKEQASNVPPTDDRGGAGVGSVVLDHRNEGDEEASVKKEHLENRSGGSAPNEESSPSPDGENEQGWKAAGSKFTGPEADDGEECMSTAEASSSVASGIDMAAKLDFDLNEGFPVDEGNQSEPVTSAIHLPSHLSFSVPSISSGVPAQITVAAPNKRPFVPPENLLKSKGELGWKGSAITSAFRPAEPRKVLEIQQSKTDSHLDTIVSKQGRPPLDIDLNIADERLLEDLASQSSAQERMSGSGHTNNRDLGQAEVFGSSPGPGRIAGGLDLDLNRVDEGTDGGQFSAGTSRRIEVPVMTVRSSSSSGLPNGGVNVLRDFDLNNGPGLDEVGTEPAPRIQHSKSNVPFLPPVAGLRMNNAELGSLSWFPPGNSYPAVAIPSILPDRGEQPYSIVAPAGAQRIVGPPAGGSTFMPDVYRGSVLSSSPAVAFSVASPFPYPGFPFGPSFPLPSTSFSGGSTAYVDSSSGGGICFPAVPSQLVGPAGAVSSHYPRPYVISLPDSTSNAGAESSRKWGRHCLDLNAGPGATDVEGRDDRIPSASRQLPVAGSLGLSEDQVRMYHAAGAVLKRKEPEGGWKNSESFSYNQSWQ